MRPVRRASFSRRRLSVSSLGVRSAQVLSAALSDQTSQDERILGVIGVTSSPFAHQSLDCTAKREKLHGGAGTSNSEETKGRFDMNIYPVCFIFIRTFRRIWRFFGWFQPNGQRYHTSSFRCFFFLGLSFHRSYLKYRISGPEQHKMAMKKFQFQQIPLKRTKCILICIFVATNHH